MASKFVLRAVRPRPEPVYIMPGWSEQAAEFPGAFGYTFCIESSSWITQVFYPPYGWFPLEVLNELVAEGALGFSSDEP